MADKRYRVVGMDNSHNMREYQADSMEHINKKIRAWKSHGWRVYNIFDNHRQRYVDR